MFDQSFYYLRIVSIETNVFEKCILQDQSKIDKEI